MTASSSNRDSRSASRERSPDEIARGLTLDKGLGFLVEAAACDPRNLVATIDNAEIGRLPGNPEWTDDPAMVVPAPNGAITMFGRHTP